MPQENRRVYARFRHAPMWLKALISLRLGSSPSALILDRRRPAAKDLSPTPSVAAVSLPPAAPQHPQAAAAIAARRRKGARVRGLCAAEY